MEKNSSKPPPFTVVGKAAQNAPNPPRKLGSAGEALWFRVQDEFRIEDCGGQEILMQICLAQDRLDELASAIEADGARVLTKSGPKAHPCLKEETSLRGFVCRQLSRLGITEEVLQPVGRPPKNFGWKPDAD